MMKNDINKLGKKLNKMFRITVVSVILIFSTNISAKANVPDCITFNVTQNACVFDLNIFHFIGGPVGPNITSWSSSYVIDWGDGAVFSGSGAFGPALQHSYTTTGTFLVTVKLFREVTSTVPEEFFDCVIDPSNPNIQPPTADIPGTLNTVGVFSVAVGGTGICCFDGNVSMISATSICIGEAIVFTYNPTGVALPFDFSGITFVWDFGDGSPVVTSNNLLSLGHTYTNPGTYNFSLGIFFSDCNQSFPIEISIGECVPCEDCIGSFAPLKEKKYVLSAWVKENTPSQVKTYTGPQIVLNYPVISVSTAPFSAKGKIIDGWQRIEEVFIIPTTASKISVKLNNIGTNDVFFDDIRIHPFNANMKSFVYDPITLRLVAELDENNYATFYEYDEEGKLIRVKKETERGIKTIQESRDNTIKQ